MAKKHAGADANDSDYNEEPNFEDPPGFVDTIGDEGEFGGCQRITRGNLTSLCGVGCGFA